MDVVTLLRPAAGPLAILVLTVMLVLRRPWRLNEAWAAMLGAALALGAGWARWEDLAAGARDTAGVLGFLVAVMLLAGLAEMAGVFRWAASWTLLTARGRGWLLFVNIYLLGALITLLLSLDVTAVVLTPLVCAVVLHLRIDPRPFVFACAFVSNTASLALPVSNLTNIMVYELLGVSFWDFLRYLALPNLVAMAVNLALFVRYFWRVLPGRLTVRAPEQRGLPPGGFFRSSLALLVATIAGLLIAGILGWTFWPVAAAGAALLAALAIGRRWATPRAVLGTVAWGLPPFVIGMYVVVAAVYRALEPLIAGLPAWLAALPGPAPLFLVMGAVAAGVNVVNNLPLALAVIQFLRAVPEGITTTAGVDLRATVSFGALVGANLGPNLTVIGSLATMLVLASARRQGITISAWAYARVGLLVAPPMLLATTATLWLLLR